MKLVSKSCRNLTTSLRQNPTIRYIPTRDTSQLLTSSHLTSRHIPGTYPPPIIHLTRHHLHSTAPKQSVGVLVGVAVVAVGSSYLIEWIAKYRAAQTASSPTDNNNNNNTQQQQTDESTSSWFSNMFTTYGKGYYQGGFEETMTRREAALILGVRETATKEKIREAHRRMALLNHPDKGGSPYLALKINQARDLLLGGT